MKYLRTEKKEKREKDPNKEQKKRKKKTLGEKDQLNIDLLDAHTKQGLDIAQIDTSSKLSGLSGNSLKTGSQVLYMHTSLAPQYPSSGYPATSQHVVNATSSDLKLSPLGSPTAGHPHSMMTSPPTSPGFPPQMTSPTMTPGVVPPLRLPMPVEGRRRNSSVLSSESVSSASSLHDSSYEVDPGGSPGAGPEVSVVCIYLFL